MDLFQINDKKITYIAEGNANLTVGLEISPGDHKVLRLIKDEQNSPKKSRETLLHCCKRYVDFQKAVIIPYFGEDVVESATIVRLSRNNVEKINRSIQKFRPVDRLHKTVKVEDDGTYALLFSNHCSLSSEKLSKMHVVGPVYSVEIKVKQGYVKKEALGFENAIFPEMCIFCLRQYYKLKNGQVLEKSKYCPFDLFSGCPERMHYAIESLFQTPQNNFRIFQDLELLYSDEIKTFTDGLPNTTQNEKIRNLSELIVQLLLKPVCKSSGKFDFENSTNLEHYCKTQNVTCSQSGKNGDCTHNLPPNCILSTILKLQQLDNLDINTLHALYMEIKDMNKADLFGKIGVLPRCELPNFLGKELQIEFETRLQYSSRKVWEFLLALIVKDASVLLTFQEIKQKESIERLSTFTDNKCRNYAYQIKLIDTDIKAISKVEKVYQDRNNIADAFLEMTKSKDSNV